MGSAQGVDTVWLECRQSACVHLACTGATAKEAEALEEVAGEYCARAFHSRTWQLREAALNYLIAQLNDLTGKPGAFRTLINCVRKVGASSYLLTLQAWL
jgi:hypothetical protein